ncbi:MAG: LysR family transcriptional regulator [Burkholderiaceae bacterium]
MTNPTQRKLSLTALRAFEAVARRLSFRAAADELHLTQSAISRQIKGLEDELGATLFVRGTRHVEVTPDGQALRRSVEPWLTQLDTSVRQIRQTRSRRRVSLTTFASFASLWLLPRLEAFQRVRPDIDIRISAHDVLAELDDPELDLALRYIAPDQVPPGAVRLFGELLTPVVSRSLLEQTRNGTAPPLRVAADLARHTLAEEDDGRASAEFLSWRHWLGHHGLPGLQPRRWVYLNFTYQQVQAALAGHGVALARMALVADTLQRGELVEPFGPEGRIPSPYAYWLAVFEASRPRKEVGEFCHWIETQAALTRSDIGEMAGPAPIPVPTSTPTAAASFK